jgi:hypothetical protein
MDKRLIPTISFDENTTGSRMFAIERLQTCEKLGMKLQHNNQRKRHKGKSGAESVASFGA